MALRECDDKHESTPMHKMNIYGNAVIDDIASCYALQPRDKR